jgi:hypothetical protein
LPVSVAWAAATAGCVLRYQEITPPSNFHHSSDTTDPDGNSFTVGDQDGMFRLPLP